MFCENLGRSGGNGSRKTENMRASEYESRRSSEDLELKDMKELESNDEAFHLSWREISAITDAIRLRITPTPETYKQWNKYEASFYLKICTCFGFNPQHLEPEDENVKKKQHLTAIKLPVKDEVLSVKDEDLSDDMDSYIMCEDPDAFNQLRKDLQEFDELECTGVEPTRSGPLVTGFYVCEPRWIPYHLYLLVKKAAETITRKDLNELDIVEEKIKFFCTYFISHLPCGWKYERDNVNSLIAKYETMSGPKFSMNGFTPLVDNLDDEKFDESTDLTEKEMADVMTVIHSRKMPDFTKMGWQKITFHCKLCSCFGIKYTLEGASDDDVYLMDFGRNG